MFGTRNVTSVMSKGRIGSTPWAMKNGEWPVDLRVVMWLAQKVWGATAGHFAILPSHALTIDSRIIQCWCLTIPLVWELYAEMCMCLMP